MPGRLWNETLYKEKLITGCCIILLPGCLHIVRFGPDGIYSMEWNKHVPVWNHNITLVRLDEGHTRYTDQVEIHAGWKTLFVWLWANLFYAHRQKKWVALLENAGMDDKKKSKSYFNSHSSTIINRNGYWSYDYRITSEILKRRKVKNLIDIGCGNGAFLAMFHKTASDVKISGLDLSREMVSQSKKRLPEAEIVEGDAENMPFAENTFDAVSCHMSIHHHPHPEKNLSEMYRILEKHGTVLINDLTGPAWLRRFINWWFTKWPTGDHAVYSRTEMEDMMQRAGFKKIRSRLITPFTYVCVGRKTGTELHKSNRNAECHLSGVHICPESIYGDKGNDNREYMSLHRRGRSIVSIMDLSR